MSSAKGSHSISHETLFNACSISLYIPDASELPAEGDEPDSEWPNDLSKTTARKVAFLDEKLLYFVTLTVLSHHLPSSSTSPPPELLRFLSCLQLNLNSSFIPPLPAKPTSLREQQNAPPSSVPGTSMLAPGAGDDTVSGATTPIASTSGHLPYTPNPFPVMKEGEGQYATSEGATVWEGPVEMSGSVMRKVARRDKVWEATWKGEVPVAYVRTQIQDPLLSVTVSVTLRDTPQRSPNDLDEGPAEIEHHGDDADILAGMQDIDLLGGLTDGGIVPSSRLAHSIQQDLSLPIDISHQPHTSISIPSNGSTNAAPSTSKITPPTSGLNRQRGLSISIKPTSTPIISSVLRKSFRRVLTLSSGLRVRMRTLFLPQLLAPVTHADAAHEDTHEGEGERRVALCVEVENPPESSLDFSFDIETVSVEVGGKGGKATAELVCQPEQIDPASPQTSSGSVFPLKLDPVEQYNLLYSVSISSAPEDRSGQDIEEALARDLGKGDEQRPVAIIVTGRPFSGTIYPTKSFQSRWNCTLDLTPFYASTSAGSLPVPSIPDVESRNRNSKTIASPPNALVGDKRYSLATLASNRAPPTRQPLPRVPSMAVTSHPASRVASVASAPREHQGLMVSVKVLAPETHGKVVPLEPFSLEIFVHNRTDDVRRFRLSMPGRDLGNRVREVWEKRRVRGHEEPSWGVDDPILRQILLQHLSSSPALIPLENDVRCGPLFPGASMSARVRFMALREGVHKLEKMRVTGINEDLDFVMSPVIDVVVGRAA
ncbi:TRAPP trafficking subunit Trs65-domain-containing protein [Kockovaella imperatae]|uniref:TRAPP trafficking subunit Trs65-domain-containing protein n=1 Tax=Kockovaella imperatae TaxID=4999 RepID=A0A1Y1UK71_9TREE|nr:TRAPP trafficking subunit Trs65-domain-containing protein [Kockovaella imperatae]ORX37904.1 TRAPP trafficking subunit Trs65-domain-containing protein [Kockovaella imperatae]